jgi:hypothetical protein
MNDKDKQAPDYPEIECDGQVELEEYLEGLEEDSGLQHNEKDN